MILQSELEAMEAQVPSDQWPLVRQVYLDLVLAKMWKTIQIKPGELTFIEAVEPGSPAEDRLTILPINEHRQLSVEIISDTFAKLEKARGSDDLRKITFAIVSSDSTIVYYHIHKGLVPPSQR